MNKNARKIEFSPDGPKRFQSIPLEYPLRIDGEDLKKVTVHRLDARSVKELQEAMDEQGFLFERLMQPFTDQDQDVLDALDQDDFARVAETVIDFLPVSLRNELEGARAQMEAMLKERMEAAVQSEADAQSSHGDPSSPTSHTPSSGAKTIS